MHVILLFVFWHQNLQKQKPLTMHHIKRMDVEVLSGRVQQLESLTSEIQEKCLSVLSIQPLPSRVIHCMSLTHTNIACFQLFRCYGSEKKWFFFCLVISRAMSFFLVAVKYMPTCGHSHTASYARAHTLEGLGGVEAYFSAKAGKSWG